MTMLNLQRVLFATAVGLLGADLAHAQSPSGTPTPSPTQPNDTGSMNAPTAPGSARRPQRGAQTPTGSQSSGNAQNANTQRAPSGGLSPSGTQLSPTPATGGSGSTIQSGSQQKAQGAPLQNSSSAVQGSRRTTESTPSAPPAAGANTAPGSTSTAGDTQAPGERAQDSNMRRGENGPAASLAGEEGKSPLSDQETVELTNIGDASVRAMQEKLQNLGLYQGGIDGIVGPETKRALRAFYRAQVELVNDGKMLANSPGLLGSDIQPVRGEEGNNCQGAMNSKSEMRGTGASQTSPTTRENMRGTNQQGTSNPAGMNQPQPPKNPRGMNDTRDTNEMGPGHEDSLNTP
jgi:hypothetical protein